MTRQDDLSNLDIDARAHSLVDCVNQFIRTLNDRAGTSHSHEVIHDETYLDGSRIGQAPEQFIYEELIKPVATKALDYELRYQPKGFNGLDGRIPDFEVLNLDAENFGEVKSPGGIVQARKESVAYLDRAEQRPLVGFATDGLVWILHTASEGEEPTYTRHVPLHELLRKAKMIERDSIEETRHRELRKIGKKFVSEFNLESIESTVGTST